MKRSEVFLVVAVADNGVIGNDGGMPWHISADFRRVKSLTMGKPLVMGRKTFESLPGVLPGRRHIVITRDASWQADGAERAGSLDQALKLANAPHIVIFGGAQIYAAALPLADRIEWTEVHAAPDGDTRFPAFDRSEWTETFRESHPAEGRNPAFDFVTLVRKPSPKQEG
ncbi:dihydrofolate reductase [Novosphingobium sp.]|uniref:dihydrofolate reductase n=1 Tax=Novosphingobium sp. TaxID=1874826 RepID=UPI00273758AB|nr:dihydrofolate reductase [Novosphingobium sp.]MDP3906180.1 dihydrofolate reductase [Novosphingobium sp.]